MNAIDQIRALYDYNEWANGHLLDTASQLGEEQFDQKPEPASTACAAT